MAGVTCVEENTPISSLAAKNTFMGGKHMEFLGYVQSFPVQQSGTYHVSSIFPYNIIRQHYIPLHELDVSQFVNSNIQGGNVIILNSSSMYAEGLNPIIIDPLTAHKGGFV